MTLEATATPETICTYCRSEERRVGKECRSLCDWSSDVCSSDLHKAGVGFRHQKRISLLESPDDAGGNGYARDDLHVLSSILEQAAARNFVRHINSVTGLEQGLRDAAGPPLT